MEKTRTLGLYQPFASLMAYGKIETRFVRNGKKPPFPLGQYLIYSCRKFYDVDEGGLDEISTPEQIAKIVELQNSDDLFFCEFGSAIVLCDLTKIIDPLTEDIQNTWVKYVAPDSCYRRVGLVFENVKRIVPFDFKGKQGIGFLSDEDFEKIVII